MSQPFLGSTSPSTHSSIRKVCPCTRRHLWPSGRCGNEWAASSVKSWLKRTRMGGSHSAGVGRPDVLVELDLEANWKLVLEDPGRELLGLDAIPHGPKEDRAAFGQLACSHLAARPLVVGTVGDHELELVGGAKLLHVLPSVASRLAACRALHVDDANDARIDGRNVERTGGLEQHAIAAIGEARHQGMDAGLQQGLPTRDFDQREPETLHLSHDFVDRAPCALIE